MVRSGVVRSDTDWATRQGPAKVWVEDVPTDSTGVKVVKPAPKKESK